MARGVANKNYWVLLLLVLAGVVLGGFIGELTSNISFLSWLNYGQSFGPSQVSTEFYLQFSFIDYCKAPQRRYKVSRQTGNPIPPLLFTIIQFLCFF